MLRPSHILFIILLCVAALDGALYLQAVHRSAARTPALQRMSIATAALGLTDLCVTTEARYTRHPAVSDPVAPFMDHPGAMEHFPSGSFLAPPP